MVAASSVMASATVLPSSSAAARASVLSALTSAALATTFSARAWKSAFLATKSVSARSSTRAPSLVTTRPLLASRSAPRAAALAAPFTRRASAAFSKSPSVSTSAFLHSIMPAPVRSRSFFTSAAVTSAMTGSLFLEKSNR